MQFIAWDAFGNSSLRLKSVFIECAALSHRINSMVNVFLNSSIISSQIRSTSTHFNCQFSEFRIRLLTFDLPHSELSISLLRHFHQPVNIENQTDSSVWHNRSPGNTVNPMESLTQRFYYNLLLTNQLIHH